MSVQFYDKDDIKIDKQVQSLSERLDTIRRVHRNEAGYIRLGENIFNNYDGKLRERVADLFTQETKWMRAGTVVGTAVGALAIWELFQGVKMVLRWVGNKIAQQDDVKVSRSRIHARSWNNK
jgi:hypothetical protein